MKGYFILPDLLLESPGMNFSSYEVAICSDVGANGSKVLLCAPDETVLLVDSLRKNREVQVQRFNERILVGAKEGPVLMQVWLFIRYHFAMFMFCPPRPSNLFLGSLRLYCLLGRLPSKVFQID